MWLTLTRAKLIAAMLTSPTGWAERRELQSITGVDLRSKGPLERMIRYGWVEKSPYISGKARRFCRYRATDKGRGLVLDTNSEKS